MKLKIFILMVCSLVFLSCNNPVTEDIAQNKVKKYLESKFKNDKYKPILFGELDSAFTTVKKTSEYQRYSNIVGMNEVLAYWAGEDIDKSMYYADSAKFYKAICDSLKLMFKPDFTGWKIQHIYQTQNDKNEIVVNNFIFYFDENLRKIKECEQVYRNLPFATYTRDTEFYGIK